MNVDAYLRHVPTIEGWLAELRPDAIVWGMGPTAWLLPWIDQRLLAGVRMWTCHDGCRIMPAHDVALFDAPVMALHPDTTRFRHIVDCRPQRFWLMRPANGNPGLEHTHKQWLKALPEAVRGICTPQKFCVWDPNMPAVRIKPKLGRKVMTPLVRDGAQVVEDGKPVFLEHDEHTPDTIAVSPTGTTTLAWAQGARRIGVIGVDMMRDHHHTFKVSPQVDAFFVRCAEQANAAGGVIRNLSPVTSLERFAKWTPYASSSEPISGSATQEPSKSSNTASGSTLPAMSN